MSSLRQQAILAAEEQGRIKEQKRLDKIEQERQQVRTNIENKRQLGLQFLLEKLAVDMVYEQIWLPSKEHPNTARGRWVFMVEQGFWVEHFPGTGETRKEGMFVVDFCPLCGEAVRRTITTESVERAATTLAELGIALQRDRDRFDTHVRECKGNSG